MKVYIGSYVTEMKMKLYFNNNCTKHTWIKINVQSKLRIRGYSLKIILLLPTGRCLVIEIICYSCTFFILTQKLNPTPWLITDRDLDLSCLVTLVVMEMKNQSLTARSTRILVHVLMMRLLVLYVLKVSCIHAALAK